jgi:hypothetical protein
MNQRSAELQQVEAQLFDWDVPASLWSCARSRGMSPAQFAAFWRAFVATNADLRNSSGKLVLADPRRAELRGYVALRDAGWPRLAPEWVTAEETGGAGAGAFACSPAVREAMGDTAVEADRLRGPPQGGKALSAIVWQRGGPHPSWTAVKTGLRAECGPAPTPRRGPGPDGRPRGAGDRPRRGAARRGVAERPARGPVGRRVARCYGTVRGGGPMPAAAVTRAQRALARPKTRTRRAIRFLS